MTGGGRVYRRQDPADEGGAESGSGAEDTHDHAVNGFMGNHQKQGERDDQHHVK